MAVYVTLLRGINVGGNKLIKMDGLRCLFEDMGYVNVSTYLQSGNVVFTHKTEKPEVLANAISVRIAQEFGHSIGVVVLPIRVLQRVVERNPFNGEAEKNSAHVYVTFLASRLKSVDMGPIESATSGDEAIILKDGLVYLCCPSGYGKTKLSNGFLEKKLGVMATTRNWKTTLALHNMAQSLADGA